MILNGEATQALVVHAYPETLAFVNRHGAEAMAVLDDLVAHAQVRDGQLVVAASVRQVAERLVFTSKDSVNRRLRQLLAAGVVTRIAIQPADRFAVPLYVLHLVATGVSRSDVASTSLSPSRSAPPAQPLPLGLSTVIDTMALTPLSQVRTDECIILCGTVKATR